MILDITKDKRHIELVEAVKSIIDRGERVEGDKKNRKEDGNKS